VNKNI